MSRDEVRGRGAAGFEPLGGEKKLNLWGLSGWEGA